MGAVTKRKSFACEAPADLDLLLRLQQRAHLGDIKYVDAPHRLVVGNGGRHCVIVRGGLSLGGREAPRADTAEAEDAPRTRHHLCHTLNEDRRPQMSATFRMAVVRKTSGLTTR